MRYCNHRKPSPAALKRWRRAGNRAGSRAIPAVVAGAPLRPRMGRVVEVAAVGSARPMPEFANARGVPRCDAGSRR